MVGRKRKIPQLESPPQDDPNKIQRQNREQQDLCKDRDYLDTSVMPALYLSLQRLLELKPERPLKSLAAMLTEYDENPPPSVLTLCKPVISTVEDESQKVKVPLSTFIADSLSKTNDLNDCNILLS